MKSYQYSFTAWQFEFLKWVRNECPPGDLADAIFAYSGFLRAVRKLEREKLITWADVPEFIAKGQYGNIYKITERGLSVLCLLETE